MTYLHDWPAEPPTVEECRAAAEWFLPLAAEGYDTPPQTVHGDEPDA